MSEFKDRSDDLMPSVFNLGALNPALAAILSTRPLRELDFWSENEPNSVSLSLEKLPCCVPLLFTRVFPDSIGSGGRPRKSPSLLLLLGGSGTTGLDPISSPNIAEKNDLGLGLGGTQSPIIATLSSTPAMQKLKNRTTYNKNRGLRFHPDGIPESSQLGQHNFSLIIPKLSKKRNELYEMLVMVNCRENEQQKTMSFWLIH
jgi:hypothetical protein